MSDALSIGVVGTGSLGQRGALDHLVLPDVTDRIRVGAVCDTAPGRAQAAADAYDIDRFHDNYDSLLRDGDVEAVTLCTPIGLHYEQGLKAIRAGKHVHFNKTMATTAAEATILIDAAEAEGVRIVASPGQMAQPQNRLIRDLIADGAIGDLIWAATGAAFGDYHETEPSRQGDGPLDSGSPEWYWKKPGGGPMYDMTVYSLHTLTGILGPARRVTSMSGTRIKERTFRGTTFTCDADDNTLAVLDFGDALYALAYGVSTGELLAEFEQPAFFGTQGSIVGRDLNGEPLEYPGRDTTDEPGQVGPLIEGEHATMEEAHVFQDILQLADYVKRDTRPFGTAEHARHVIEIIESAYRAAATGETQTLTTSF